MNKIRLNVLGISYSQTQTGAYALVLAEEGGKRRIPIIVGGFEAQAIAIQLEGLKPPRPLTHDLFYNFSRTFEIDILEVTIHKLEEGVFHSKLTCYDGNKNVEIDTRTSDAIALALRFKCPIYTTSEIIDRAGIVLDFEQESSEYDDDDDESASKDIEIEEEFSENDMAEMDDQDLNQMLQKAIKEEDYEKASMIRDELNRRQDS
ncbi:MAG: bifunctional nuclease family protein [Bacteroidales bacterium]|nr:bifunctional nuclease family protein [Bacteroidales bacterium]